MLSSRGKAPAAAGTERESVLLRLSDDLVGHFDRAGRPLALNPAWLHGAPTPDHLADLFEPGERADIVHLLQEATRSGFAEAVVRLAGGSVMLRLRLAARDDGTLYASAPVTTPSPLDGNAVTRAITTGVALVDGNGRYRFVNPAYASMYRSDPESMIGQTLDHVVNPARLDDARQVLADIISGRREADDRVFEMVPGDRDSRVVHVHVQRVHSAGGEALCLTSLFDVTEYSRAQSRLAEAEASMRALADAVPGAIYQLERYPDGRYATTYMSEGLRALTGIPRATRLDDFSLITGMMPADHRQEAMRMAETSARQLEIYEQDFPLDGPAGRRWVRARAQPYARPDGTVVWHGLIVDIHEHREAARRLAETETLMRGITASMPGAVFQLARDDAAGFRFNLMSEGLRRIAGLGGSYPLDDFAALLDLVPAPDQGPLMAAIEQSERELEPFRHEFRLQTPRGTLWLEALAVPSERGDGTIVSNGLLVDVTTRYEAEAEARRLGDILESTPDCVAITDPEGLLRYMNAGGRWLLGIGDDEPITGLPFVDFVHPDNARHLERVARREAGHSGAWQGESTLVTRTGREVPVSQTILAHLEPDGRVDRFSTIIRDLSERVAAERDLAASEARLRTLYNRSPVMMHSVDRDGWLLSVNEYWLEVLGYARDEVIGHRTVEFFTPESRHYAEEETTPLFQRQGWLRDVPFRMYRRDGTIVDVLVSVNAERDERGEITGGLAVLTDVTERRRAEAGYRDIFANAHEGIYRSLPDGRLLQVNPSLVRMHAMDSEEALIDAVTDLACDWYVDSTARARLLAELEERGRVEDFEAETYQLGTGDRIWISESARAVYDEHGSIRYLEGSVRDITAERRARSVAGRRAEVLEMIARGRELTDVLYEVVGIVEQHHSRLTAGIFRLQAGRLHVAAAPGLSNECIAAIDRSPPSEAGSVFADIMRTDGPVTDVAPGTDAPSSSLNQALRAAGYSALSAIAIRDQQGVVLGVIVGFAISAHDVGEHVTELLNEMAQITAIAIEQNRLAEELLHQAQYDALTELPNRALLNDRLEMAIREARHNETAVGVLLLDIDEFKLVNDTLGHSAGDELLREVAMRLHGCVRAGDTVARLGGDEFVLVLNIKDPDEAGEVAERVLTELQAGIPIQRQEVAAHPSIGISLYPQDGGTAESLLQAADTAMYSAKHAGKNRFRYFAETMNTQVSERFRLEAELRSALDGDELVLYFQPRVNLVDGTVTGAEALLRWQHPRRGLLPPGVFLPTAERSPLIGRIDRRVVAMAADRAAVWQTGARRLILSANISARDLHTEGFATAVATLLDNAGVDPAGFELEITESMVMQDFERSTRQLRDLKERAPGLRIAVDDFGSGYSSLNYLRHLPIDTLKIDRSFVDDLTDPVAGATARAIARTIIDLGRNLELTVIAEGVETRAQADELRRMGCLEAQGYLFAEPMPDREFARLLD